MYINIYYYESESQSSHVELNGTLFAKTSIVSLSDVMKFGEKGYMVIVIDNYCRIFVLRVYIIYLKPRIPIAWTFQQMIADHFSLHIIIDSFHLLCIWLYHY